MIGIIIISVLSILSFAVGYMLGEDSYIEERRPNFTKFKEWLEKQKENKE